MLTRGYEDQSILNMTFKGNVVFVDPRYNVSAIMAGYKQYSYFAKMCGYAGQMDLAEKCVIQHMVGAKPWERRWFDWQKFQLPFKSWMKVNYENTRKEFGRYAESVGVGDPDNLKIVVSYSFPTEILPEFRKGGIYVKVGGGGFSEGMDFTDNSGDGGLSKYNVYINEMTVMQWTYSNYAALGNPEYIGFDHYRRVLKYNRYALKPDVIQCEVRKLPKPIGEEYRMYHVKSDLDRFTQAFNEAFPDLAGKFKEFLDQNTTYPMEIFVMHRDMFFECWEFLRKCIDLELGVFSLNEFDSRDKYQKRGMGFIMERMTSFWIYMKRESGTAKVIDTAIDVYNIPSPYQRPDTDKKEKTI